MDDLISRQAAILAIEEYADRLQMVNWKENPGVPYKAYALNWAINTLRDLPSAQPKHGRWIPCSERLPNRFGKMLVTFIPGAGTLWTQVIIANYSDLMGIAKPCFWIGNVGKNDFANITSQVVAWMPLPEPYKTDEVSE